MKKYNKLILSIFILLSYSCDDILEEDITNDTVQIISPTQGLEIEGNTVNFHWQALDGADDYRIQVYNQQQQIILDSLISAPNQSLSYILSPGMYQWRIKGENFAYQTPYNFPVDFSVIASEDLTNQTVQLNSPSDNIFINQTNFFFSWESLTYADNYTFELIRNLNGQQIIYQEDDLTNTTLGISGSNFSVDAEYIWKVKAKNNTSETAFSENSLFLDRVAPNQPTLNSPSNEEVITDSNISFNWLNGADTGNVQSTIENTIEISGDFNFSTLLDTAQVTSNNYQLEINENGTYYWRVKAVDAAGNVSDYSSVRSFTRE